MAGEFKPLWDQATIEVGGEQIKPLSIKQDWHYEYVAAGRHFNVIGDTVREVDPVTCEVKWSVASEDHWPLKWMDASEDVGYFMADREDADGYYREQTDTESIIRRLDLQTHAWLAPLHVPKTTRLPSENGFASDVVRQVLAGKNATSVLLLATKPRGAPARLAREARKANEWRVPLSYRVALFAKGEDKPRLGERI